MNRYLVFASRDESKGGWEDFFGSFGTETDAVEFGHRGNFDWWEVVDLRSERVIRSSY